MYNNKNENKNFNSTEKIITLIHKLIINIIILKG